MSFYSLPKKLAFVGSAFLFGFGLFCFSGIFNKEANSKVLGESTTAENCQIKGDVNSKGQKIYYLETCTHYDKIIVNPSHGETWFCAEADAQEAGFTLSPSC